MYIVTIDLQLDKIAEAIVLWACEDETVRLLLNLSGVGVHTALLLKADIGPIGRFENYTKLVSWAGDGSYVHQLGSVLWNGLILRNCY